MASEHAASITARALVVLAACTPAGVGHADPIHSAVQRGDVKEVEKILKANPQAIDAPDQQQQHNARR